MMTSTWLMLCVLLMCVLSLVGVGVDGMTKTFSIVAVEGYGRDNNQIQQTIVFLEQFLDEFYSTSSVPSNVSLNATIVPSSGDLMSAIINGDADFFIDDGLTHVCSVTTIQSHVVVWLEGVTRSFISTTLWIPKSLSSTITSFSSLAGLKVGVYYTPSTRDVLYALSSSTEINLINDPALTVFSADANELISAVLDGTLHAIIVPSGLVEMVASNAQVRLLTTPVVQASPFGIVEDFPRSSPISEGVSLGARRSIPLEVVNFVQQRFFNASNNDMVWSPPPSYSREFTIQQNLGVLSTDDHIGVVFTCPLDPDPLNLLSCGADGVIKQKDFREIDCLASGITCPFGLCVCGGCQFGSPVEVRYLGAADAGVGDGMTLDGDDDNNGDRIPFYEESNLCVRGSACGDAPMATPIFIRITHTISHPYLPVRYHYEYQHHDSSLGNQLISGNYTDIVDNIVNFTFPHPGVVVVSVLVGGEYVDGAPFLLHVVPIPCDSKRDRLDDGTCACNAFHAGVGPYCVRSSLIIALSVIGALLLLFIMYTFYYQYKRVRRIKQFLIAEKDLTFSNPRKEIGLTSAGPIYAARFRSNNVMVKPIVGGSKMSGSLRRQSSLHNQANPRRFFKRTRSTSSQSSAMSASSRTLISRWCGANSSSIRSKTIARMEQMKNLRHPQLVHIYGIFLSNNQPNLIVDYYPSGNLHDILHNGLVALEPDVLVAMLKDIIYGMIYLHNQQQPIVHGNLCSHAIMIDGNFSAKISNYSKLLLDGTASPNFKAYSAPEVLTGHACTLASDVYAFAILAGEIVTKAEPYHGEDFEQLQFQIVDTSRNPPMRPDLSHAVCTVEIQKLIKLSWHPYPDQRPSFTDLGSAARSIKGIGASYIQNSSNHERRANILADVFPSHIIEKLRKREQVENERLPDVCVFYAEIVDFAHLSEILNPLQLSDMLDRVFCVFDRFCKKYGLFKLEMIGTSYACASNLQVGKNKSHIALVCRFALDVLQASQSILIHPFHPHLGYVNIRAAVHCDSATGAVIGSKNPQYTLFGPAIEWAETLEMSSLAGYIQVSESVAYQLEGQAPDLFTRLHLRGNLNSDDGLSTRAYFLLGQFQLPPEFDPVCVNDQQLLEQCHDIGSHQSKVCRQSIALQYRETTQHGEQGAYQPDYKRRAKHSVFSIVNDDVPNVHLTSSNSQSSFLRQRRSSSMRQDLQFPTTPSLNEADEDAYLNSSNDVYRARSASEMFDGYVKSAAKNGVSFHMEGGEECDSTTSGNVQWEGSAPATTPIVRATNSMNPSTLPAFRKRSSQAQNAVLVSNNSTPTTQASSTTVTTSPTVQKSTLKQKSTIDRRRSSTVVNSSPLGKSSLYNHGDDQFVSFTKSPTPSSKLTTSPPKVERPPKEEKRASSVMTMADYMRKGVDVGIRTPLVQSESGSPRSSSAFTFVGTESEHKATTSEISEVQMKQKEEDEEDEDEASHEYIDSIGGKRDEEERVGNGKETPADDGRVTDETPFQTSADEYVDILMGENSVIENDDSVDMSEVSSGSDSEEDEEEDEGERRINGIGTVSHKNEGNNHINGHDELVKKKIQYKQVVSPEGKVRTFKRFPKHGLHLSFDLQSRSQSNILNEHGEAIAEARRNVKEDDSSSTDSRSNYGEEEGTAVI
eukprot:m.182361 g.182361  ORF g.182361 m.182361 type:complete len:1646 (-) comp13589_c0_seq12:107-5044(-)